MTETKKGKQLIKLRLALNKALQASMSACTKEKIASAFPSITRDHPNALDTSRDQIVEFLSSNCKEEFETVLKQRNLDEKLVALDSLKEQKKEFEQVLFCLSCSTFQRMLYRFEPTKVVKAHILQEKKQELLQLEMYLEQFESENLKLQSQVQDKTQEMSHLMSYLEQFSTMQLANKQLNQLESSL
jgi:hypothetical protein